MSRLTAIMICLIAAAIGLQPWIGQARTEDGDAKPSAVETLIDDDESEEDEEDQVNDAQEADSDTDEAPSSYLQELIQREVAAMKAKAAKEKQPVADAKPQPEEDSDREPTEELAEKPTEEATQEQDPQAADQTVDTPLEPASASDVDEPESDSMQGPSFTLPANRGGEAEDDNQTKRQEHSAPALLGEKTHDKEADGSNSQPENLKAGPLLQPELESNEETKEKDEATEQADVEQLPMPLAFPESATPKLHKANERLEQPGAPLVDEGVMPQPNESLEPPSSEPLFEAPRSLPVNETERAPKEPMPPAQSEPPREASVLSSMKPPDSARSNRFPALPPDPYAEQQAELTPLADELVHHGGPYLYESEGAGFQQQALMAHCESHNGDELPTNHSHHAEHNESHAKPPLRLPEWYQAPQPFTTFAEYLGADPIQTYHRSWPGPGGYEWEPRFVAHGRYDVFGVLFQENDQRQDFVGHNLTLDADLRLTGTERFHMQYRPIGEDGTGGSFYRFDNPEGYVDNSTAAPSRLWFEGEVASLLSGWLDGSSPAAWDMNLAIGLFPLGLHNNLLMNDEVAGIVLGQNNGQLENLSNLNVRGFWLWDEVDAFQDVGVDVLGVDAFIDYRHAFIEATYAYRKHGRTRDRDAHYLAISGTQFFGPSTLSARALAKVAGPLDQDGQLFVAEWNTHRRFDQTWAHRLGVEHGVVYATAFWATQGWSPISGANFNRIRTSFEVNPLVQIARGDQDDTPGIALGVQLFGEQDFSSLTPEIAWEAPGGQSVFGTGVRYQRRTSVSSFLELRGLVNFSDNESLERDGVFTSHHWLF